MIKELKMKNKLENKKISSIKFQEKDITMIHNKRITVIKMKNK